MSFKSPLNKEMSVTAYEIHRDLLQREARGPGDIPGAMRRLEAKYGLDYWKQWMVRYKRKDNPDFRQRLQEAQLAATERTIRHGLAFLKTQQQQERGKGHDYADIQGLVVEAESLLAKIQKAKVRT